jgi:hypothetical protein
MDKNLKTAYIAAIIIIMVFSAFPVSADFSEQPINVTVDGRILRTDVPPVIMQGRTMIPFRSIFEALGAVVHWDESTRTVTGSKDTAVVTLRIGSRIAVVNGVQVPVEVPGIILGGRTMVPARFVAESLGADVRWIEETRTVAVDQKRSTDNIAVEPPEIPAGASDASQLEHEIIQAYRYAYSLEEKLWDQPDAFETKEAVFQYMKHGFIDDFAALLADYYWSEPEGLVGAGAYLIVPEDVYVLVIDLEKNHAELWHETDEWEREHWGMDAYKIVTLQMEGGIWKVNDERSVSAPPS